MKPLSRLYISVKDWLWRQRLHRLFSKMKSVGRNVYIGRDYMIYPPSKVKIGDNVFIGDHFVAHADGGLTIGSGTVISTDTEIRTGGHNYDSDDLKMLPYDTNLFAKPMVIGENVWIATHVKFAKGVKVGEGAVIGMGSIVTKDIPPLAVVAGNPAKVIKYRNADTYYRLKAEGKIYLNEVYDYDRSTLKKSEYLKSKKKKK